jgi:probable HAF family extracellular repeat protein
MLATRLAGCVFVCCALAQTAAQAGSMYGIRDLGTDIGRLELNAAGDVAGTRAYVGSFFIHDGRETPADVYDWIHLADDGRLISGALPSKSDTGYNTPDSYTDRTRPIGWRVLDRKINAANDRGILVGEQILNKYNDKFGRYDNEHIGIIYSPASEYDYANNLEPWSGPSNAAEVHPNAINNDNLVAGSYIRMLQTTTADGQTTSQWDTRAFVGGTDIGTLPGGTRSEALALNELGHAVGVSNGGSFSGNHAFLYADGSMMDLGTLAIENSSPWSWDYGTSSRALGVNNHDQVVGRAALDGRKETGDGTSHATDHAFFYDPNLGVMLDLNTLIPPDSGWLLNEAININDAGQIIGFGTYNGERHGFFLEPMAVPEPGTLAVVLMGVAALGVGRRWMRR